MPQPERVPDDVLRGAARESWEHVKPLWPDGPDRYVELMLARPDYRALAQSLYVGALRRAYEHLRTHAREYRGTKAFRETRARWELSDRRDDAAGRRAHIHEFFARGIEAGARDLAELLGTPEHELPEAE